MSQGNLVGQTLGQYHLRELLGVGGMGAVYRAYQISLKREVAVKIISSELVDKPDLMARFIREAEISAKLEHPNIVPIHDFGTQDGITYVVMRLLTGKSLSQRIEQRIHEGNKLISLGEIADLLKQVGSALDYAHSHDVIHRDIKPANIMFDNQGKPYVVDFGIAKLIHSGTGFTQTGMAMGTPNFMPPEQWRGEDLTPQADQYALGVMIYQLLTGRLPFEADSAFALMHKHLNEMPTPLNLMRPDIPQAVITVINRALAKEPSQRFLSCTAFAQAFESAIEGNRGEPTNMFMFKVQPAKPSVTPIFVPHTPIDDIHTPQRTKNWLIGILGLGLILIVTLLLVLLGRQPQNELVAVNITATNDPTNTSDAQQLAITQDIATITAEFLTTIPTPNIDMTVDARITQLYFEQQTQTATAFVPSATPTVTLTRTMTLTPTPSLTPTETMTPTSTPTIPPIAFTPVAKNEDWTPIEREFDGVAMVLVPVGCFMMGTEGNYDAEPVHLQCFDEPFWVDKYEVYLEQFEDFGGERIEQNYFIAPYLPVETINWFEARDYCRDKRGGRLLTEAEWEYVARGPNGFIYPWGDEFIVDNAIYLENSNHRSAIVGERVGNISWVGAMDMSGNIWEWVSSLHEPYPYDADDGRERDTGTDLTVRRLVRGGTWNTTDYSLTALDRISFTPDNLTNNVGLRCMKPYTP